MTVSIITNRRKYFIERNPVMNRKEEIIYATLELASVNGMKGISMAQIADKVGIKAPSLYNHFGSKDEIIREMYAFLRKQARTGNPNGPTDYSAMFEGKNLEEILLSSVSAYIGIVSNKNMLQFFRVLYSERSTNPTAAAIMVEETERMIAQTRDLFYALAVHGKINNKDADMAAMTYALTIHSLIDYRMDMITADVISAGEVSFGDNSAVVNGNERVPEKIAAFIKWFSNRIGGGENE